LFSIENGTVTERQFLDSEWALSPATPPDSQLKAFLVGEAQYRTEGWAAIKPIEQPIPNAIEGNTINIPTDQSMTTMTVSTQESSNQNAPVLQLFSSSADPIFEASVLNKQGEQRLLVPSISTNTYSIKNSSGTSLTAIEGVSNLGFLPSLSGATTGTVTPNTSEAGLVTAQQIKQIEAEDFPLVAESAAAARYSSGGYYLAYSNQGRIDLAYRSSIVSPFRVVRDVCIRVPSNLSATSQKFPQTDNPFMLMDVPSGNCLLFYVYKTRLVVKRIPVVSSFLTSAEGEPLVNRYAANTEAGLIANMHNLSPVVVYDGYIADRTKDIKADIQLKVIVLGELEQTTIPGKEPNILTYSAVILSRGQTIVFIQDSNRIIVRKSNDNGLYNWTTITNNYIFLPKLPTESEESRIEAESPSAFYSCPTDTVYLFMFYDGALIQMSIPAFIFNEDPLQIQAKLDTLKREVIYGKVTENISKRGITSQLSVQERIEKLKDKFDENISSQRLAIASIDKGHFRLFYRDSNGRLATLFSSDTGMNWQTQDQYIEKGNA